MGSADAEDTVAEPVTDWRTYPDLELPPILTAALADFQEHGYHGTTVRAIAARAGLTMPSLYYHYGNKEGILFALLEAAMDDLETHIDRGLMAAGNDTLERFRNFVAAIALHNTHRRRLAALHDEFRFLGPTLRAQYVARRAVVEDTLENLLQAGISEGRFDGTDPRLTARVLLGLLRGILDWYREDGPLTATEIADRYTCDALRLVLKSPRSGSSADHGS